MTGMPTRERIVLVVAAGLGLATLAGTLSLIVWNEVVGTDGGWFAYAPNTGVAFTESRDVTGATLAVGGVWLVAIAIWTAAALWLLRRGPDGA
jgi:hypothetical protein